MRRPLMACELGRMDVLLIPRDGMGVARKQVVLRWRNLIEGPGMG